MAENELNGFCRRFECETRRCGRSLETSLDASSNSLETHFPLS